MPFEKDVNNVMDTNHKAGIDSGEALARLSRQNFVAGSKQLRKAVESGKAEFVVLARDADPAVTEPLAELCRKRGVTCVWTSGKKDLGRACRIEVGAAAAAAIRER